jgi:hypothetical protein
LRRMGREDGGGTVRTANEERDGNRPDTYQKSRSARKLRKVVPLGIFRQPLLNASMSFFVYASSASVYLPLRQCAFTDSACRVCNHGGWCIPYMPAAAMAAACAVAFSR